MSPTLKNYTKIKPLDHKSRLAPLKNQKRTLPPASSPDNEHLLELISISKNIFKNHRGTLEKLGE